MQSSAITRGSYSDGETEVRVTSQRNAGSELQTLQDLQLCGRTPCILFSCHQDGSWERPVTKHCFQVKGRHSRWWGGWLRALSETTWPSFSPAQMLTLPLCLELSAFQSKFAGVRELCPLYLISAKWQFAPLLTIFAVIICIQRCLISVATCGHSQRWSR